MSLLLIQWRESRWKLHLAYGLYSFSGFWSIFLCEFQLLKFYPYWYLCVYVDVIVVCRVPCTFSRRISVYLSSVWIGRTTSGISLSHYHLKLCKAGFAMKTRFNNFDLVSVALFRHLLGLVLFMVGHICWINQSVRYVIVLLEVDSVLSFCAVVFTLVRVCVLTNCCELIYYWIEYCLASCSNARWSSMMKVKLLVSHQKVKLLSARKLFVILPTCPTR